MAFQIPAAMRTRIIAAAAGGAISIAGAMLGGSQGLEGQINEPYRDVGGVWTVCSGVTGSDVIIGKHYSDRECDTLLMKHVNRIADQINPYIRAPIPATTRAALISFAYNVGPNNLKTSTLLRLLNMGERKKACEQLSRWVYVGKQRFEGLANRRQIEMRICLANDASQL